MTVELRTVPTEELVPWRHTAMLGFAISPPAGFVEASAGQFEPERTIGGWEDGRWVSTAGNLSLRLAIPGGHIPMAGVTSVTVRTTHRRRGLLRQMMDWLLDDAADRGEAVSGLVASEAPIYGRFGFGPAAFAHELVIDRRIARLEPPVEPRGTVTLDEAVDVGADLRALWNRWWPTQPGEIERSEGYWQAHSDLDPEAMRKGGTARLAARHRGADGQVDGYALYRIHSQQGVGWLPQSRVQVEELVALTPTARLELWAYLLGVDLVAEVHAAPVPVDEPLSLRVTDLRQVRTVASWDRLWIRILDVPAALAARSYAVADRLVLEVLDPVRPDTGGRYRLEAGPDGAEAVRAGAGEPADLVVGVAELGALWLGGVTASQLVGAGRLVEATPGAAGRADRLFAGPRAPFNGTVF